MSEREEAAKKIQELIDNLPKSQLAMLKLEWALEEVKEKYRLSVNMHSGDKRWYSLTAIDFTADTPYSVQLFLNEDDEVRINAKSVPVLGSMAQLSLGDFSYPNPAWTRQFRIFKDMVGTLYDEYEQK